MMARVRALFWPASCSVLLRVLAEGGPPDANHLIQATKRMDIMADYHGPLTGRCTSGGAPTHLTSGAYMWGNIFVPPMPPCHWSCDQDSQCMGYEEKDLGGGSYECWYYNVPIDVANHDDGTGIVCYVKMESATASGDPHCRNVKGESFDITATGEMTMLEVPGPSSMQRPNLRVKVVIGHISDHDACSPTVIKEVKIGGGWLAHGDDEMRVTPGRRGIPVVPDSWMEIFKGQSAPPGVSVDIVGRLTPSATRVEAAKITVFQTVILLLQRRGTRSGVDYFDMRVTNIMALGKDIRGLLGNDPHDVQAAPPLQCSSADAVTRLQVESTETDSTNRGMMSVAWVE